MKDQTHTTTSTDSRQAATTATTTRRGRPSVATSRRRNWSDYNNNPRPFDGRTRKRIAVFIFEDTAERLRDYCEFAKVSQWGLINSAIETFLNAPTDSDTYSKIATHARDYKTKWTGGENYTLKHRQKRQQERQRVGNQATSDQQGATTRQNKV